jgi:hypothetical protein
MLVAENCRTTTDTVFAARHAAGNQVAAGKMVAPRTGKPTSAWG